MTPYASVQNCTEYLHQNHDIVCEISCDYPDLNTAYLEIYMQFMSAYQKSFQDNQRLIVVITKDFYAPNSQSGTILGLLQSILCDIDISNFFVCLVTTNPDIEQEYKMVHNHWNQDPIPLNLYVCQGDFQKIYVNHEYFKGKLQSLKPIASTIKHLDTKHRDLLFVNDAFCIAPWVATYIGPDSSVKPCCLFDQSGFPEGNIKKQSLKELWNSGSLRKIRKDLLENRKPRACQACYERESLGRDSLRKSLNRGFAHHINLIDNTIDGRSDVFSIRYWDVRYNNLCNFACRSCNHVYSTSWYKIHNKVYPDRPLQKTLLEPGDDQDRIFQEFCDHLDHVEEIYFAGGEPAMIDNFYRVLELLDQKKRHDIKIKYNINLSRLTLKQWNLAKMWKRFQNISVGASLDAMGLRAEYLRSGTAWPTIVENRKILLEQCPHIDFYINATTGLINALHIPDFHRSWVDQDLISPEDFNIQLLMHPTWMSVKNAPNALKSKIIERYQEHLAWLEPKDSLGRAASGYRSIIDLCRQPDRYDPVQFWTEIDKLDRYHHTNLLEYFPELSECGLDSN